MVAGCKNGDISKTAYYLMLTSLKLTLYETTREPLELLSSLNEQASIRDLNWHLLAGVSCPDVQTGVLHDVG